MATIFGAINVETPAFETVKQGSGYELRKYAPQVRAEYSYTVAPGSGITDGLNSPFMVLAGYIFGKNKHSSTQQAEKVAMTSPVVMSYDKPEKIAMTAPVVTQQQASGPAGDAGRGRRMAFIMPSKYGHAADLPLPLDAERVKLVEVPPTSYAAVRFKGTMSAKTAREQEQALREACAKDGVALSADAAAVQYCSYNPPWALPWLRTNDILIPLAADS